MENQDKHKLFDLISTKKEQFKEQTWLEICALMKKVKVNEEYKYKIIIPVIEDHHNFGTSESSEDQVCFTSVDIITTEKLEVYSVYCIDNIVPILKEGHEVACMTKFLLNHKREKGLNVAQIFIAHRID